MARAAEILYLGSVTIFVASSFVLATLDRPAVQIAAPSPPEMLTYGPWDIAPSTVIATLPQLYAQPQTLVMWALLVVLWVLLLMDGIGQYLDPSDRGPEPAWRPMVIALGSGAVWPWLVGINKPLATLGAMLMLTAALSGAVRAKGQRRPAVGFLAGWGLALGTATVATLVGGPLMLTISQMAILAILPGAVIGMIAQDRLGQSISFSLAMIWAFCAVAITTMGASPGVALSAIIGISGMCIVLVRAAT